MAITLAIAALAMAAAQQPQLAALYPKSAEPTRHLTVYSEDGLAAADVLALVAVGDKVIK